MKVKDWIFDRYVTVRKVVIRIHTKIICFLSSINTRLATRVIFRERMKYRLNLKNPKSLSEKLQYLKLNYFTDNEVITRCADKYRVKDYVVESGLDKYIKYAKTLAVYKNADEINWDALPDRFVLKCNHDCGSNLICESKEKFDKDKVKNKLAEFFKRDYWKIKCETQYKNIDKLIFAEEYLEDAGIAYKVYCFHGEPKFIFISYQGENWWEKSIYHEYFDTDWNTIDVVRPGSKIAPNKLPKPDFLDKLLEVSRIMSAPFPFVRCDLYVINGEFYLSEFTFLPRAGMLNGDSKKDEEWGSWLDLSSVPQK